MRKHLSGGILSDVSQQENDRVLTFTFTARNELGDQTKLDLIVEIMARHSNIILVDQATGKIIDAIKHVARMSTDTVYYFLVQPILNRQNKIWKIHLKSQIFPISNN